jgi:ABC-type branched-subunit amino acid transport system substrate-binding protein
MSTTDETQAQGDGAGAGPPPKRQPGWVKPAKRYGPIVVVIALIGAAVLVFGGGGDDGDDEAATDGATTSEEELISSGPLTWQKAEQEGETANIDWGPNCDTETGRIKLVSVYAPPCVEPFEGDNGGATSAGVTADTVKVVEYIADPALDPLTAATVAGAGADVNPETNAQTVQGFADLYNKLYETYGRRVEVETYTGTGAGDDVEAAKADAIAIAEKDPFIVIGGPQQAAPVFSTELASRGIICAGTCATAIPQAILDEYEPFIWQNGPTPNQGAALAAEMIGKLAGPGKAELAGDDATKVKDRVYGLLHYDNADGDHEEVFEALKDQLAENGIELATDIEFTLDLARAQENARTNIARLQDAGVTTIIYYGDPLTPGSLTKEATAQNYHPEWIMGPTLLMDTSLFARLTDMQQWKNGFGISLIGARGAQETDGAFRIWDWAYGGLPPNNTANVINPGMLWSVFPGIHLAGPELTPETFRDGLLRYPPAGGGPTQEMISRGEHGIWPDTDLGGIDDATIVWFDPTISGEDEVGNEGVGLYRYANGARRYSLGHFPDTVEDAGLFDNESSVTIFDEVPLEDQTPDYPPPE